MNLNNLVYLTALNKREEHTCDITTFSWNRTDYTVTTLTTKIGIQEFKRLIQNNKIVAINFDYGLKKLEFNSIQDTINHVVKSVREFMVHSYGVGVELAGHCIEASEIIVKVLSYFSIGAKTLEGWCIYDIEDYGSDCPYDAHTWVELTDSDTYIDVTADQFNFGMFEENNFDGIIIKQGLPHGMVYDEPTYLMDYEE